ncbi:MAG: tRNA guanosine(34) transglycosylase Tgt [Candidatus Wildermuthbacteria bacterium]|nr:tRNA guanosine(34) transglycosylase Tgt [Candidatus Wildermuthbacteria bacterium]
MKFFEVVKQSKKSKARLGLLSTPHGTVRTPAFVPVATRGTIKAIPPKDIPDIGIQIAFVNTFHLALHPGGEVLKKFGGIHKYSGLNIPLMSDSAGFQVFSLGRASERQRRMRTREGDEALLLGITEEGARFRSPVDGNEIAFTPEFSMQEQARIGADIVMAFDECIYYGASKEYAKKATQRTHEWLLRCVAAKKIKNPSSVRSARTFAGKQMLYGIVQGGTYKDLREESAKFVAKQHIDGIAIGGVAVGETTKEMKDAVGWVAPYLPPELPRHLLGIGRLEDIVAFVRQGMDSFDCVELTRLARNGIVFQKKGARFERYDLTGTKRLREKDPIEKDCPCYACRNFSVAFIHHLFRERELLGYYLATYHNLSFFERAFQDMREKIEQGNL